jgi:hypothetical protein
MHPKLFKRPKGGFLNEIVEEEKNWGTLPHLQHFGGRRACQSSEMGLRWTHK